MRTTLLATLTLMALAAPAMAADLRSAPAFVPPPPAPVTVVAVPSFTWTGFSVGVHGAWVSSDVHATRTRAAVIPQFAPTRVRFDDSNLGGGAQIGYSMQFGTFVAGLDADITATNVERTRSVNLTAGPFRTTTPIGSTIDFIGTVKGRLGVTLPSPFPAFQQSMFYVTGGFAYAGIDNQAQLGISARGFGQVLTIGDRSDDIKAGFVVGAGTEVALTNSVSIRSETLYYNLNDDDVSFGRANLRYSYRIENDGWISRVGVNIKLGAP